MTRRMMFLASVLAFTVALFVAAKAAFVLACGAGHGVTAADCLAVAAHGLGLDLSTALYVVAPALLASAVGVWVRVARWVLRAWWAVASAALALALVADVCLYGFWGFKLDASCLQYLGQPGGMAQSVGVGWLLARGALVAALGTAVFWVYNRLTARLLPVQPLQPLRRRLSGTALHAVLAALAVVGMRGGTSESTTNIGQVYYSQNQFLNHAAVNPVFSFLYSLAHQLGDLSEYDFMADDECRRLTANVFTTESTGADTLLRSPRPNIVVVLLESAGEQFAGAMPRLQQLKREGVSFGRCYANSWRTDRGTVCLLSGYPSFPTLSVMKMPQRSRSLPSLARTLAAQGYATAYLYGGDINFTNMRSYLVATGWQRLTSMDDFAAAERRTAQWGVRDDIAFSRLRAEIVAAAADTARHHLWGFSTLSSHEPWDVPPGPLPGGRWAAGVAPGDEVANAFAYLDFCLGQFVDSLRSSPAWKDLLIVVTADHGINHADIDPTKPLLKNHIPMLWLGGAVKEPRRIDVLCNQSDLAATLLGQLGLPHRDFLFSRDVTSATYTYPTAVHNYSNAQMLADSTGCILYDLDGRRLIVNESADADRLLRVSKAILQLTIHNLKEQ